MFNHPLHTLSQADSMLARLTEQSHYYIVLDRLLKKHLPAGLRNGCMAVCIRNAILMIHADSGMVAARLRMLVPDILPKLAKEGYLLQQARVRVVLRTQTPVRKKQACISDIGLAGIRSELHAIQHPAINQALDRLLKRHAKENLAQEAQSF